MTSAEWQTTADPWQMLKFLRGRPSPRKLRLLLCAFCRQSWSLFESERGTLAIELGEQLADGSVSRKHLRTTRRDVLLRLGDEMGWREEDAEFMLDRFDGFHFEDRLPEVRRAAVLLIAMRALAEAVSAQHLAQVLRSIADAHAGASDVEDCHMIREVLGNSLQAVHFIAEWRTSTVTAIAQQMYDSRDFSPMPILADALQDAGCDNADLLDHCRDAEQVHVRGCWVVDAVLGKE